LAAWLGLATVLICFATVYLRYALGIGLIWLQEAYVWSHTLSILWGSAFAFRCGGFICVDIFAQKFTNQTRCWIDIFGSLFFLAPFVWFLSGSSFEFFYASAVMAENSAYEGGIPGTYILKGMVLVFAVLIGGQGIANILKAIDSLLHENTKHETITPNGGI
jgi:TRAP-type mannitol/chloroaromatic compound transport system permease small subunit